MNYRRAIELATARARGHYQAFRASGDLLEKERLLALRDHFAEERIITDLAHDVEPPIPFANFLPTPRCSTVQVVRQIVDEARVLPSLLRRSAYRFTVSHPEYPSGLTAVRALAGVPVEFQVEYEDVPTPDPREPVGPVPFTLWRYEGARVLPGFAPPAAIVARELSAIALTPFHRERYGERAQAVATRLRHADWASHLLGAMVNPPAVPAHYDPILWTQKVQVAAALVLAFLAPRHLETVALGPVDAVCDAAIIALGYRAELRPSAAEEVGGLFKKLEARIPRGYLTCYEPALAAAWRRLPQRDEAYVDRYASLVEADRGHGRVSTTDGDLLERTSLSPQQVLPAGPPAIGRSSQGSGTFAATAPSSSATAVASAPSDAARTTLASATHVDAAKTLALSGPPPELAALDARGEKVDLLSRTVPLHRPPMIRNLPSRTQLIDAALQARRAIEESDTGTGGED